MHRCTGRAAHRGSRDIALLFLDHDTRRGWGVSVTPRPLFTPGKDPVPIVHQAGWVPGPVWTGAENLSPTGVQSPDRPARSQSLYRLRYPAHDGTDRLSRNSSSHPPLSTLHPKWVMALSTPRRKTQNLAVGEATEKLLMMNFIICAFTSVLFGWWSEEGWDDRTCSRR